MLDLYLWITANITLIVVILCVLIGVIFYFSAAHLNHFTGGIMLLIALLIGVFGYVNKSTNDAYKEVYKDMAKKYSLKVSEGTKLACMNGRWYFLGPNNRQSIAEKTWIPYSPETPCQDDNEIEYAIKERLK